MSGFSYSQVIFNEAAINFVKSISNGEWSGLHPSPGLADSKYCCPYHIVVKRNKRFMRFWKKSIIFPTSFTLADLLEDKANFSQEHTTAKELVSMERSLKFNAKGSVGISLADEVFGGEVAAGYDISLSVNLGQIEGQHVEIKDFIEAVGSRKINLKHDLVREVMADERDTLCVIVTSLRVKEEFELATEVKAKGSADLDIKSAPEIDINGSGEVNNHKKRTLKVPGDTPIAFRMLEILVGRDGSIQLMVLPGSKGGFVREAPIKSAWRKSRCKRSH